VSKIAVQQARDAETLKSIRSDVTTTVANYRLIHGTLKSVLARLPDTTADREVDTLKREMGRLGSAVDTLNQRIIQPADVVLTPGPDDLSCKRPSFSDVVKHQPSTANNTSQIQPPDVSHTSSTPERNTTNIDAARTRCDKATTHVAPDNQTREDTV